MKRIIALCALLACLPAEAQQVYRWTDGNGRVQYGDKPPPDVEKSAAARAEYQLCKGAACR